MSLESSIAALTTQAGLLLDLPQAIHEQATAKINEITAAYASRISSLITSIYVDQTLGVDTNPGTSALPVKTLQKAVSMTPLGGLGIIFLKDHYTQTEPLLIQQKYILITSANSIRYQLSFSRLNKLYGATQYRELAGFRLQGNCGLNFSGLTLNLPALDGTWPSFPAVHENLISVDNSALFGQSFVGFEYLDLNIPTTPFGQLMHAPLPWTVYVGPLAFTGAATSLQGRLFAGVTNTAGTTPPAWATTNLTSV